MKCAIFSAQLFEKPFLDQANPLSHHELVYLDARLTQQTAILAEGFPVVSCFVTDCLDAAVLQILAAGGTRLIALRTAGFNHVDLAAAKALSIVVTRVPDYSPYAVAEFATGLILSLNRKIHLAYMREHAHNFLLNGLLGFDLHGRTVGVIGTGKIGSVFCNIMLGFGCTVLAYDPVVNETCKQKGVSYVSLAQLYQESDIISLHCPLNKETHHMIDATALSQMKPGVMLINTGRGALIDTKAVIDGLKTGKIGYLGLDVYEEEENLFFRDLSGTVIQDDVFTRLETFPNVLITGHQAFFTKEALVNIAKTTMSNIQNFMDGTLSSTLVTV